MSHRLRAEPQDSPLQVPVPGGFTYGSDPPAVIRLPTVLSAGFINGLITHKTQGDRWKLWRPFWNVPSSEKHLVSIFLEALSVLLWCPCGVCCTNMTEAWVQCGSVLEKA